MMAMCPKALFIFFASIFLLESFLEPGYPIFNKAHGKEFIVISMRDINEVKEAHVAELMALPGVAGVYVSALDDGTPCIKVMVVKTSAELEKTIPKTLEGHPVLIIETGEIKPLTPKPNRA